jgi:hypothetical protein
MKLEPGDLVKRTKAIEPYYGEAAKWERGVGVVETVQLTYARVHWLASGKRKNYRWSQLESLMQRSKEDVSEVSTGRNGNNNGRRRLSKHSSYHCWPVRKLQRLVSGILSCLLRLRTLAKVWFKKTAKARGGVSEV